MRRLVLAMALVGVLVFAFSGSALAAPPVSGTGTGTTVSRTLTLIRHAGPNAFFSAVGTVRYAGTITGLATNTYTFMVEADGTAFGHGVQTCTNCTIAGQTGSFQAEFTLAGRLSATNFTYQGQATITSATGGLAGLHATETFTGDATGFTYSLTYHFVS